MKFITAQAALPPAAHLSEKFFWRLHRGWLRRSEYFGALSVKSYCPTVQKKPRQIPPNKLHGSMKQCSMRKSAIVLLVLLVCVAAGAEQKQSPQQPGTSQQQSEPETTLKVDVKLVNVFVTVTDAHGAPVPGLKKENFALKEDGREQKIAVFDKESALPLSIALAGDIIWRQP